MVAESRIVILTFSSHYEAVKLKRALAKNDIDCRLVPVPRSLSSSCGTAMEINEKDVIAAKDLKIAEGAFIGEEGKWSSLLGW